VGSNCKTCEGGGRVAVGFGLMLSIRERNKRRALSRSLRAQANSLTEGDCPTCSGAGVEVENKPEVVEPPKKRKYTKRHARWGVK